LLQNDRILKENQKRQSIIKVYPPFMHCKPPIKEAFDAWAGFFIGKVAVWILIGRVAIFGRRISFDVNHNLTFIHLKILSAILIEDDAKSLPFIVVAWNSHNS
jgi:hypothetical protein